MALHHVRGLGASDRRGPHYLARVLGSIWGSWLLCPCSQGLSSFGLRSCRVFGSAWRPVVKRPRCAGLPLVGLRALIGFGIASGLGLLCPRPMGLPFSGTFACIGSGPPVSVSERRHLFPAALALKCQRCGRRFLTLACVGLGPRSGSARSCPYHSSMNSNL